MRKVAQGKTIDGQKWASLGASIQGLDKVANLPDYGHLRDLVRVVRQTGWKRSRWATGQLGNGDQIGQNRCAGAKNNAERNGIRRQTSESDLKIWISERTRMELPSLLKEDWRTKTMHGQDAGGGSGWGETRAFRHVRLPSLLLTLFPDSRLGFSSQWQLRKQEEKNNSYQVTGHEWWSKEEEGRS